MYPHLGGFESTQIFGTGQDILRTTRHTELWKQDLDLLLHAGITELRYSVPWHSIEQVRGQFDWSWIDGPMRYMHASGMKPILDPLHHTSFPEWLTDGFLSPDFPDLYARFIEAIAERYPWVVRYTVVNEPLPTTVFSSLTGMWYPHRASDKDFVAMSIQVAKAICQCSHLLRRKSSQIQLIHVDTAEHHRPLDPRVKAWVEYANERRFLIHDLVLGRVDRTHPLQEYLEQNGACPRGLGWLRDHATTFDVLGLDYYLHSEMEWFWNERERRADIDPINRAPRGLAAIARDYMERFRTPVMLSETNIKGTVAERLTWLKFMEEQCEQLAQSGVDFRGFCWYPSVDSTDWLSACTQHRNLVDPQGIWYLDESRRTRYSSELSETYGRLARGEITSVDIPAYRFEPMLESRFRGYMPLIGDWQWIEPEDSPSEEDAA